MSCPGLIMEAWSGSTNIFDSSETTHLAVGTHSKPLLWYLGSQIVHGNKQSRRIHSSSRYWWRACHVKGSVIGTGNQQERQSSCSQGAYLPVEERHTCNFRYSYVLCRKKLRATGRDGEWVGTGMWRALEDSSAGWSAVCAETWGVGGRESYHPQETVCLRQR